MRVRIKLAAKITRPENVLIAFAIRLVGYAGIESKALKKNSCSSEGGEWNQYRMLIQTE